ncbi:MAG: aminotransferase class I/II-fold pyridoxal phosphate-dependent enzyme [Candidatus Adiutrix sp.]|nr:aminotransferase class I/II-fold pyridoxal phosphate-dependent enzyme [Candidatus Adiutrix sp.]
MKPPSAKHPQTPLHGGLVFEAALALQRPWEQIIDFSANINPLGQPRGLKAALFKDFDRTLHYPETRAESLSRHLAEMTGLSADHFLPGAGSTPHFHLLARGLDLKRAPVIIGPAFAEYEGALARAGVPAGQVLTRERDDWQVTPETLGRAFKQEPGAIFLANPANPTGRLVDHGLLTHLAGECQRRSVWLALDEAFIDFTGSPSLLPLVADNPRLIIFRSLTKIFALPGLRLAFLAAHPRTMARLTPLVEPWSLSSPAISAGHFCLAQTGFQARTLRKVRLLREQLVQALTALDPGRIFPSEANFLLLRLRRGLAPRALIRHLFQDGILVRDAANFKGLRPGFLRLAVRPAAEIAALAASLAEFLRKDRKTAHAGIT